ncbi:hypothetical protein [Parapedobacter soli]|uniref:hypothetical protein n=1 Tax=Parapedobacter soli TaxID=416955 RepID=UPI0021C8D003|nr:hypothetical protein [Parapedobacter soli]
MNRSPIVAKNVAAELLAEKTYINPSGRVDSSEFYIVVPNACNEQVKTDGQVHVTYTYLRQIESGNADV